MLKKIERIIFRLTGLEKKILVEQAKKLEISVSELIRRILRIEIDKKK